MKNKIMPSLVLTCICLIVAVMLAGVNMITEPIIKAAQDAAASGALLEVLPEGKDFEKITVTDAYPKAVEAAYKADGGFVFQLNVTGKSTGMMIMCGINSDGKIVGTKVIDDNETPDYANPVFAEVEGLDGKYAGMDMDTFSPYLVAGATLTSAAYGEAMKAALNAYIVANGGSVDNRTPEEILQDNCNAALGVSGLEFKKWLKLAAVDTVDAVYFNAEAGGYVYVIGETFVGITAGGDITSADITSEDMTAALTAHAVVSSITIEELDTLPEGINKNIVKNVYKASNGAYAFVLQNKGFEWAPAPMTIKLSIDAEGKIIDVYTESHSESKGYGDKCQNSDYYDQWFGAGADDVVLTPMGGSIGSTDIGAISGATETTRGYQQAVKSAFTAFEKLTAGGTENE